MVSSACCCPTVSPQVTSNNDYMRAGGTRGVIATNYVNSGGSGSLATDAQYLDKGILRTGGLRNALRASDVNVEKDKFVPGMVSKWKRSPKRQFAVGRLKYSRGVYNWKRASPHVIACMLAMTQCVSVHADVPLVGKSTVSIKAELRKKLAQSLAAGGDAKAFEKPEGYSFAPRVDDLEALIHSFPAKDAIKWNASPVGSGINTSLWQAHHARHCAQCTSEMIDEKCYFKILHHWLRCGFEPPEKEGVDMTKARPGTRAYVQAWNEERARCETAFEK